MWHLSRLNIYIYVFSFLKEEFLTMRQDLFIDLFIVLTCSVCSFVCMDDF